MNFGAPKGDMCGATNDVRYGPITNNAETVLDLIAVAATALPEAYPSRQHTLPKPLQADYPP